MNLTILDIAVLLSYFVGIILFGIIVAARSKTKSAADYFLASKKLPWYAVGASFIASNISTEHFIGMVGWGFLYGMAVANWEWANVVTFSILIWVFLPFYMRGNVSTMPEFLERRFNKTCRYIYATVMIIGLVIAMLGGVLFAGAKAINVFCPQIELWMGILILAIAAGTYTIYGGLLSAVWADLLQYILLMIGGIIVTIFGVYYAGGVTNLFTDLPEKFIVFYPSTHEMVPWTGLVSGLFTVGLWYNCANQFMVQRCLGARSEWDARMGVVMAGFSKAVLPLMIVVPGIIAFYLFQDRISDGDQSWPFMVRQFLPMGLTGLVLAGLASAILSTLSAITNSSATIFTLDLYKEIINPNASDRQLHLVGRVSGAVVMIIGIIVGLIVAFFPTVTVFQFIQTVFFYLAPPIAACFLIGIIWRRATPAAAILTLIAGFAVYLPLVVFVIFPKIKFLSHYDNFMHHAFVVFIFSAITLVITSLFTRPKPLEELKGVIWTKSALHVGEGEKKRGGFQSLGLWWLLMSATIISLYIYTNSRGSNTKLFEAEKTAYTITAGTQAKLQIRADLAKTERFNLWTGSGQILFTPQKSGDQIVFELPAKKPGLYQIDAFITAGTDYGKFIVKVNDQNAIISYPITETSLVGKKYSVSHKQEQILDCKNLIYSGNGIDAKDNITGLHVVRKISLGTFLIKTDSIKISFIAADVTDKNSLIGIDKLLLTYRGDKSK